jgi:hypothetical protein
MANIQYTASLTPIQFPTFQNYSSADTNLIENINVSGKFNPSSSYVEYHVYDFNLNLISSNYNFGGYSFSDDPTLGTSDLASTIILDPTLDVQPVSNLAGTFYTTYNLFNNILGSSPTFNYFINEISSDRTEVRLTSNIIPPDVVSLSFAEYYTTFNNPGVYNDFYLNFGDNNLILGVNLLLSGSEVYIKLYEPLPNNINLKSVCWVVDQLSESLSYTIEANDVEITLDNLLFIQGPNLNLEINNQVNNSTNYTNYSQLINTTLTSSYNQLSTLFEEKSLEINVDYEYFANFIYLSSAQTRLENFYYKVSLIQSASNQITALNTITNPSTQVSSSLIGLEGKIKTTIDSFDGWEYYMYYESSSYAWPKTNTSYPYILAGTGSAAVLTWYGSDEYTSIYYGGRIFSASLYDNANQNNLIYSIPEYLRDDSANQPYTTFIEMIGQFFDNIWLYYQDVSNRYNTDNRLTSGISKDLVAEALRSFGLKLYQNNFSSQDLYYAFLGTNLDGNLLPFPGTTGSLPVPTGSGLDYITNYVTASYVTASMSSSYNIVPQDDINKSIYKRLYHNLPYLFKKKGTVDSIRLLANIYGIPSTILRISEFGGKDRINVNDWDQWQDQFNYAFDTSGSYYVSSSFQLNTAWNAPSNRPSTAEFRFQTRGLPFNTASITTQSLWSTNSGSALILRYSGSGYVTASYSGSVVNEYYQYAYLDFYPNIATPNTTASVYLPFYDGDWWSVMINSGSNSFTLYAANKLNNGNDGAQLGYVSSSSVNDSSGIWVNSTKSYLGSGSKGTLFSGSFQELRYYSTVLDSSSFFNYVMNPYSIEGNTTNIAPDVLAFRASLGGELYTASISIHPKVTGSWVATSSFTSDSNFYVSASRYKDNVETIFLSQPIAGIKNIISNKISPATPILPAGNTLSSKISIQQESFISESYTRDLNLLEVAFSPQNEINEDITSQLGDFNIGEYIGDPRAVSSSAETYPLLDDLRDYYFQKYISNYNVNDFVRLIKYFDNSLFKMIKDFVPANTSLSSGVVIKQHLLERNKYPTPTPNITSSIAYYASGSDSGSAPGSTLNLPLQYEDMTITASIGSIKGLYLDQTVYTGSSDYESIPIETATGSQGGSYITLDTPYTGSSLRPVTSNNYQVYLAEYGDSLDNAFNVTQSWIGYNVTPSGSVAFIQSNAQEFFDGELSGSTLIVESGSLNGYNPFLSYPTIAPIYDTSGSSSTTGVRRSAASLGSLNNAVDAVLNDLFVQTPAPGKFIAAYAFYPSGSKTGTYTVPIVGQSPSSGVYPASGYGEELYLDIKLSVGGGGFGNGTLEVPKGYNLVSASFNGGNPADRPFFFNNAGTMTAVPEVYGTNLYGITTGYGTIGNILNPTADSANKPTLSGSLQALASSGYSTGYQYFTNDTVTLYFETPLQYYWVGVMVNNMDDTGVDYSSLWQQCQSIIYNLVDKSNTTASVGSYSNGSPVPLEVSPISTTLTAVYIAQNPVLIEGLGTGDSVPFLSINNQNISLITSPGTNIDFTYNNNNAILNNTLLDRISEYHYDVDYENGGIVPVNWEQLISSSATRAAVQDSNYSMLRVINPRYNGSELTAAYYNVYTSASNIWLPGNTGSVLTYWPGDNSFGKDPVIEYYGNVAFNTDFVQGTYPELQNGTAINIKNIDIFNSSNQTSIIDQNNPDVFNFIVNQYLGYSQSAEIFSNDVSPIKDNNIRTLDGTIGFPANSTYFLPRQQTFGKGFGGVFWTGSLNSILFCSQEYTIFKQVVNDDNRYTTGSVASQINITGSNVAAASTIISNSISNGGEWYITLYSGSSYPLPTYEEAYASGGLAPYNSGVVYNYSNEFSLQAQGVYKITNFESTFSPSGISTDGNAYQMTLNRPLPDNVKGIGSGSKSDNNTGLSMLIWQSNPFPQPVIVENRPDYFPSGIGQKGGYVIPDDFNSKLKSSLFALQTMGVTTQITTGGNVVNNIPLVTEPTTTGAVQTGGTTPSTSGPISTSPFGYPGPTPGYVDSILRSDGLSDYYIWTGNQWVFQYTQ